MNKAEQFIKNYTRNCSNELISVESRAGKEVVSYHEWLTPDQALRAVEIAREEAIEKAVKWLYANIADYFGHSNVYDYANDFKNAMKDE